jgi:thiamine phosphate synthase YjbQ (UPF0047 family)
MKSLTEYLWFETPHRRDYVNITDPVEQLVRRSGVQDGLCLVNAMHITVGAISIALNAFGLERIFIIQAPRFVNHAHSRRRRPC